MWICGLNIQSYQRQLLVKTVKQEKKLFSDMSTVKNSQNENLATFTIIFSRNKNLDQATLTQDIFYF